MRHCQSWSSGASCVFRIDSSGWGVGKGGNGGVIWDILTLLSSVRLWRCAPSFLFRLEMSPLLCARDSSWQLDSLWSCRKPISSIVFCPYVPEPSVTGTAIPRNNDLISLITALRPKLMDTRFLIRKNTCYRKMLHKLPFRRGESTKRILIWLKWQIPIVTRETVRHTDYGWPVLQRASSWLKQNLAPIIGI